MSQSSGAHLFDRQVLPLAKVGAVEQLHRVVGAVAVDAVVVDFDDARMGELGQREVLALEPQTRARARLVSRMRLSATRRPLRRSSHLENRSHPPFVRAPIRPRSDRRSVRAARPAIPPAPKSSPSSDTTATPRSSDSETGLARLASQFRRQLAEITSELDVDVGVYETRLVGCIRPPRSGRVRGAGTGSAGFRRGCREAGRRSACTTPRRARSRRSRAGRPARARCRANRAARARASRPEPRSRQNPRPPKNSNSRLSQ